MILDGSYACGDHMKEFEIDIVILVDLVRAGMDFYFFMLCFKMRCSSLMFDNVINRDTFYNVYCVCFRISVKKLRKSIVEGCKSGYTVIIDFVCK